MYNGGNGGFDIRNLAGTGGVVLLIVAAALLLQIAFAWQFRGHIQL